jgi:outer membrane protein assembly factor BamB
MSIVLLVCCGVAALAVDNSATPATAILDAAGIQGGLVVHFGCGDGTLTTALCANGSFLVHGLDSDARNVQTARKYIQSLGLYGKVSVELWAGRRLPYVDNLVNLLVAENLGKVPLNEVVRVLAPLGVAYVKEGGQWTKTVKPWPKEMDEWTHYRHAADGNMVSKDALAGPPRHLQWIDQPQWQRHHGSVPSITTVVSAGGRLFAISDEPPMGVAGLPERWQLTARDAFNGVVLWRRPIDDWGSSAWSYYTEGHTARFNHPIQIAKRLVAVGDRVYVTLGFNAPVSVLDAATGKTLQTYEGTAFTDEFVCRNGVLYLSVNDRPQKPWPGNGMFPEPTDTTSVSTKQVWAINTATSKVLWRAGPFLGNSAKSDRMASMRHLSVTVSDKGVFFVDEKDVVCLEPATGQARWRAPRLLYPAPALADSGRAFFYHSLSEVNLHALICYRGGLFVVHPREQPNSLGHWKTGAILQALSVDDGRELWRCEARPISLLEPPDLFGIGGLVWIAKAEEKAFVGLDPASGRQVKQIPIEKVLNAKHHERCYPNKATEEFLLLGRRGAEFVNVNDGGVSLNHWARGGCRYGHMIANGLLYRLPDHCQCFMDSEVRGFCALLSDKAAPDCEAFFSKENALEKGSAYSEIQSSKSELPTQDDWPTYRHDALRSASTRLNLPTTLWPAWSIPLGENLTSPVVSEGRLFCSAQDALQVHALDAATGKKLWSYTVGGRVSSPPTVSKGKVIFGSADGWVYCLRAADGELAWRFQAAPTERRIMAFGRLESVWPVPGNVLVAGDVCFFVAGRASVLDGGVFAYAVDAQTGRLVERKQIREEQTTQQQPEGALADVLTTDGTSVYLRNRKIDFSTPFQLATEEGLRGLHLTADGGFSDAQWFHRAYWHLTSGKRGLTGNLIAFDEHSAFVAAANKPGSSNYSYYIPAGGRHDRLTSGQAGNVPSWLGTVNLQSDGYLLFADALTRDQKQKKAKGLDHAWAQDHFPICPWAMIVADQRLFIAGFQDRIDPKDPWATFEGRRGGVICVVSARDGKKLSEYPLESLPVWNGMAAAGGQLYLTLRNGSVVCLAKL